MGNQGTEQRGSGVVYLWGCVCVCTRAQVLCISLCVHAHSCSLELGSGSFKPQLLSGKAAKPGVSS